MAAEKGLLRGKTVAVDSTTLEANAAMKTIVRRDTGEDWNDYLRRLLQEQDGVENPTDEDLRRFDRQRKDKRVSNEEWMSPTDSDSRIAKMKDGRTHLAYKAEHVIDLETELVLAASIYHADEGDADTLVDSVMEAQINLTEAGLDTEIEEAVADKGYHATDTLELADSLNLRTYIPEPKRKGKRNWQNVPAEKRQAVINNRRRARRAKSKQLQRLRSERVERSFAHVCDTGGARRSWLHGIEKVQKRYLIATMARNLGLLSASCLARHSEGLAGRRRPCVACLSCLVSHQGLPAAAAARSVTLRLVRRRLRDGGLTGSRTKETRVFQRAANPRERNADIIHGTHSGAMSGWPPLRSITNG